MVSNDGPQYSFRGKHNEKGVQRRKHARIPVEIHGAFKYMDADNVINDSCLITSLSTGGLAFRTSCVLLKEDVVAMTFLLNNKIVSEDCKVTRTHGREIGCKFTNPGKENIEVIQKYIYKKLFS